VDDDDAASDTRDTRDANARARDETPPPKSVGRSLRARLALILGLLALDALGSFVRIDTALRDPNFDSAHDQGMLKSDPALLYYFTERILESGGLPPADFRADPRVEWPLTTDIPSMFPVGQEFAVAWCYRLFGSSLPLHVFCVIAMGIFASTCVLWVYGLALELTQSVTFAFFAAALFTLLPANYRTIGFVLVGEDFSLPWYCLHLWLLARAARVRTRTAVFLAAATLGIALSTWHATSFVFTLEAACVFAWFVRSGENPFTVASAWIFPAVLAVFALLVPVLRSTLFVCSLPMQWMLGLLAAAWLSQKCATRRAQVAAACAVAVLALAAALGISKWMGGGIGEYSHVFGLVWEKARHLGQLPADPNELSFEVRLMWQGPFDTLDLAWGAVLIGTGIVFVAPAIAWLARDWFARNGRDAAAAHASDRTRMITLACTLLAISLPIAWWIERTVVIPGMLLPVVGACALQRSRSRAIAAALAIGVLAVQAFLFEHFRSTHEISWYRPAQRQAELAELVRRVPELVPDGAPIAADFMNSTALLAHTRHPAVLQPKYEFRRSRERAERFLRTFFERTPTDLRRLLVDEFRCRHLLVDRFTLGFLSSYAAGIPRGTRTFAPGSAAAAFLSQDERELESVPGFRLLYRSPSWIRQSDGSPADFYRLYELAP
jgi:hypothetical protein